MTVNVAGPGTRAPRQARARRGGWALAPARLVVGGALAAACLAGAAWVGLHWISPNTDWIYSLAWGQTLADGARPDVVHPFAPLPHPLPLAIGTLLSPLSAKGSFDAVSILNALSWVLLAAGSFRLGRVLAGPRAGGYAAAAGLLAALMVITRGRVEFFALRGAVDVPFAALVLLALSYLLEAPRTRPLLPLSLLFAAGLIRPDAWILAFAYCGWLAYVGLRGPRLAQCLALALGPPLAWAVLSLALTGDALSAVTGNPEAASVQDFGFHPSVVGTIYSSSAQTITDDVVERVRSVLGDELALVGLLAILWSALGLLGRGLRTPERARFGVVAAAIPILLVQTIVLVDLGAPLSDRYVLTPAVLLVVLAAAFIWLLPRPGPALAASVVVVMAALTAAMTASGHLIAPTLPIVRAQVKASAEERREQDALYALAARRQVRAAIDDGCTEVTTGGLGGPHYALEAKPMVAQVLDIGTEGVGVAPVPPHGPYAADFVREMPPKGRAFLRLGVWSFQSPCLPEARRGA